MRPLTSKEMNVALAIKQGVKFYKDLDLESETSFEKTVRNCSGLFGMVVNKKIYLLHQTARDFLLDRVKTPEDQDTSKKKKKKLLAGFDRKYRTHSLG